MKTPHRKECSQGPGHVSKDLFFIQKWAFKHKYYTYALQNFDYVSYDSCPSRLGVCGGHSLLEIAATAEQSIPLYWNILQVQNIPRIARGFQNSYVNM
jgi:hypothetical protein